jgi:hypothetical protein
VVVQACATGEAEASLLVCVAAQHRHKGGPGVVWLEEDTLGRSLRLSLSHLLLGVPAASIVGGMRFLSVHQLALAACQYRFHTALFQAFLVKVSTPTPHSRERLLAVSPDMAELLAVVTLTAIWQSLISLNILWDFDIIGKVTRTRGIFTVVVPSAGD